MLFMSGTPGWYMGSSYYSNNGDMDKTIGVTNGSDAYLDMKCSTNTVHIIWRNPDTWKIMDEQALYLGSGFNTTSSIELVRECTLAQGVSGSYLKNVTWRNHYLYSTEKTVKAQKSFFKSSRNGFSTYNGNYLTKGTGSGNITNMNYYGETMNLSVS